MAEIVVTYNNVTGAMVAKKIDSSFLVSGILGSGYLADGAVTSSKVGSGQLAWPHVAAGGLLSASIGSGQLGPHVAAGGILSSHVSSGQIGTPHLATGVTLTSPTIQGTVLAGAGLTWPAITLGGAVAGGDQTWTNVGDMTFAAGSILASGSTNGDTLLLRANDTTFITLTTGATDVCTLNNITMSGTWLASGSVTFPALTVGALIGSTFTAPSGDDTAQVRNSSAYARMYIYNEGTAGYDGQILFVTANAAVNAGVQRFNLGGKATTSVAAWTAVGISHTFIGATTANSDNINPAPTAIALTMANTKSFTGIAHNIVLPAIVPVANGAGITLTGLNMAQGAITNAADTEAITVRQIIITGAAGAALATGVYSWTGINITTPAQAANGAVNTGFGIKITGGAMAGGAGAYQRGIEITMAAATDVGLAILTGLAQFGVYAAGAATDSTGYITILDGGGTSRKVMIQA